MIAPPASAWGWQAATLEPLTGGLINTTFAVVVDGTRVAVLQRLHHVFAPEVNLDLEAVTAHLAAKVLVTPRLIRTQAGEPWTIVDGRCWRALTWVDGISVAKLPGLDWATAGGELVGTFHRAVADLQHDYAFVRSGVHDTAAHLARLAAAVESPDANPAWRELGHEILASALALPALPDVPLRHIHGDLKLSNLMFAAGAPPRGVCLVDLDTLGKGTLAFELGDAMRSWCNPHGEDQPGSFDVAAFAAAIRGFRSVAGALVTPAELRSVAVGLETVCIELAARFATDVFRDEYFGWDPSRFASRREHNLIRARGQLVLGHAVRAHRQELLAIVAEDRV